MATLTLTKSPKQTAAWGSHGTPASGGFLNKIICGDVLEVMRQIPDGSIDIVVTSPPYNLKNSTGNGMKDGRGGKWANAALQKGYSHHNVGRREGARRFRRTHGS